MKFRRKNFLYQVIILTSIILTLSIVYIIDLSTDFTERIPFEMMGSINSKIIEFKNTDQERKPASESKLESNSIITNIIDNSLDLIKPFESIESNAEENVEINELEVEVLKINCDFALSYKVNHTSLRLTGECNQLPLSILNLSNGYEGSIFISGKEYTTDFIRLRIGVNKLKVQLQDSNMRPLWKEFEVIVE